MPPIAAMIADPRLAAEPIGGVVRHSMRAFWIAIGVVLLAIGFAGMILPGPGLPFVVVGLIVILKNSRFARKTFVRTQRRHPKVLYPLRRMLGRWQDMVVVMYRQTLKTERLVLRRFRFLSRMRRAVFHRARA